MTETYTVDSTSCLSALTNSLWELLLQSEGDVVVVSPYLSESVWGGRYTFTRNLELFAARNKGRLFFYTLVSDYVCSELAGYAIRFIWEGTRIQPVWLNTGIAQTIVDKGLQRPDAIFGYVLTDKGSAWRCGGTVWVNRTETLPPVSAMHEALMNIGAIRRINP